jgi:deoxyribonuclease V
LPVGSAVREAGPVKFSRPDDWPTTAEAAEALQLRLRDQVDTAGPGPRAPRTVAGLDVAYAEDSSRLAAAVVVLDAGTLETVECAVAKGTTSFPYVPGLFAFRELPTLLDALESLETTPDLLICDGHGRAHPRRFGLASHLGLITGVPSIGVAKNHFVGDYTPPGPERGDFSPLIDDGEIVGRVLRTRTGVRPVFVSAGHGVDLDTVTARVLDMCPAYRLPETTRRADALCRSALHRQ